MCGAAGVPGQGHRHAHRGRHPRRPAADLHGHPLCLARQGTLLPDLGFHRMLTGMAASSESASHGGAGVHRLVPGPGAPIFRDVAWKTGAWGKNVPRRDDRPGLLDRSPRPRTTPAHHPNHDCPCRKTAAPLGRPPKFPEPCTQVTITLPDRILQALQEMDADRAKAIVRCVETVLSRPGKRHRGGVRQGDRRARTHGLRSLPGARRHPLAAAGGNHPSRYLLAVPSSTAVAELEVALLDLADTLAENRSGKRPCCSRSATSWPTTGA